MGVPSTVTATWGGSPRRIQAGPVTEERCPADSVSSTTTWPRGLPALTSIQHGPLALTTIEAVAEVSW